MADPFVSLMAAAAATTTIKLGTGTPFDRRWRVLRERVLAMKALWTQEEATFHGEFVNFARAISYPKPMQTPHPPILFGGATAQGRARVVEYCNGWIPIDVLLDDLPAAIADLRRRADVAGRRPDDLSVSVFAFRPPTPDAVKRMQDMGVERVTLVAPRRLADALPFLDDMARLHASRR
jgi:alkanesulfonate monooxygenase SsuD/methylene tetrahydromethanopterin reductase-like flavin-dependent oxidoreductase (luciferase family)